jgi:hypothetical protein
MVMEHLTRQIKYYNKYSKVIRDIYQLNFHITKGEKSLIIFFELLLLTHGIKDHNAIDARR